MSDWKSEVLRMRFDENKPWSEIIGALQGHFPGKSASQIRDAIRGVARRDPRYKGQARAAGQSGTPPAHTPSNEWRNGQYTSDRLIEICETEHITPNLVLKLHGLKPGQWEVVSYKNNFWHAQKKDGVRMVMYQSKLTVKPHDGLDLDEIAEHFERLDRKFHPPVVALPKRQRRLMAEVNIADLHLGKLCWHGDTGSNYDSRIARDIFYRIVEEVAQELRHRKDDLDQILFVWTNDFFNSDTIMKTTTLGTPQDTDRRWQALFNTGVEMLVAAHGVFADIAPVRTFCTRSNHDEQVAYYATKYLSAWFRKDPRVTVDTAATPRKYILYGRTLLGYGHGEKENSNGTRDKASRLASLMPIEAAHLWGRARFREFHAAHLHSEQMHQEINGVIVRRISSPTAADTWHTDNGFVGAIRKAQTFIYDKERGPMLTINTPVE